MKFIYKIIAIVYRTYVDRGQDIPHFRGIVTILFLLFLNIVCIALLFDIPSQYIMPWSSQDSKAVQWIKAAIYFAIPVILFSNLFSKDKLDRVPVTDRQSQTGRTILPI